MSDDILTYVQRRLEQVRPASATEVHALCPFCDEPAGKRGRLYVNVDPNADIPGLFVCFLCGAKGSLVSLQRHFGDASEAQEKEDDGYIRRAILEEAASFYHQCLVDHPDALTYLKVNRGLTIDTIMDHRLGFAGGGLAAHLFAQGFRAADLLATGLVRENRDSRKLVDFLTNHITIPYRVAGNVVMIRGRDLAGGDRKYVTPPGQKARLFNSDVTWVAEQIIITEGELDGLVLDQLGFAAVAVPGANTWQDAWDGYFREAKRVYVVFDCDEAGERGAAKVIEHLGPRARRVELPQPALGGKVDVTDWVVGQGHTAADFAEMLRASSKTLLITVHDAIEEHSAFVGVQGLRFGFPDLDDRIAPGLMRGQVAIILGKNNSGKTVACLNIMLNVCLEQPAAKVLFVSLEQTRGEWWERARRMYRFHHIGSTDLDARDFWSERLLMVDRNRLSVDELNTTLDDFDDRVGQPPDLVVVDYMGYWARAFRGEEYQRVSDAVMALKEVAKDRRLPIVSPHQVNRTVQGGTAPTADASRGSGVVEETADLMLAVHSPDDQNGKLAEERSGDLFLTVLKSRHGGKGVRVPLVFAPLSLVMVPAFGDRQKVQHARDEMTYLNSYHNTWEAALMRHEAGLSVLEMDFHKVERELWRRRQGELQIPTAH